MYSADCTLLGAKDIYNILIKKGVSRFHHANTVKSALSFISEGALLSRSFIESNKLSQTIQYTDEKDKKLEIWDSVFLDGLDLHKKFLRPNLYGPVLFVLDLKILLLSDFQFVRVTKSNTESWHSIEGNFYESSADFERDYLNGDKLKDGRIMFLFDRPEKNIQLKYCKKIIVDDPRIDRVYSNETKKAIAEMISNRFINAVNEINLEIPIEIRHKSKDLCNCYHQYKSMYRYRRENFDRLFKYDAS